MTYEEAVNDLVRRYCNGEFKGWVLTDDYTAQLRRDLDGRRYEFVELRDTTDPDSNTVVFYHSFVDLEEYSDGELWFYGSLYNATKGDFEEQGAEIAAECVFEETSTADAWGSPKDMLALYLKVVREENNHAEL